MYLMKERAHGPGSGHGVLCSFHGIADSALRHGDAAAAFPRAARTAPGTCLIYGFQRQKEALLAEDQDCSETSSHISIIPGDLCARNGFNFQCAHWRLKQYLQSVRRPEIPENFRRTQFHFLCAPKPSGFFNATKPSARRALHLGLRVYLRRRKLGTSGVKPRRGCPRSSLGLS